MSTEIAKRESGQPMPVQSTKDLIELGTLFMKSGMFGVKCAEQGVVLATCCHMRGMDPLTFTETYHIIQGRPSMRADAMLAAFIAAGGDYEVVKRDSSEACMRASIGSRKGEFRLSWEDAQKEPFVFNKDGKTIKDNWKTPRARMQMLWARVVSDAVRTLAPQVNHGAYAPEELGDDPAPVREVDITAQVEQAAKPKRQKPEEPEVVEPEVVKPETTEAPAEGDGIDFTVMPVGKKKGVMFAAMTDKMLQQIVAAAPKHPEITEKHVEVVKGILKAREDDNLPMGDEKK